MNFNVENARRYIKEFQFQQLFLEELGWSAPSIRHAVPHQTTTLAWQQQMIAQLSGVMVFEISMNDGAIPLANDRQKIHDEIAKQHLEHILIFLEQQGSTLVQALWSWVKRDGKKRFLREHVYVRGQSGDLLIAKIAPMFFDLSDFDVHGNTTVGVVARRVQQALDVERTIKKFYRDYDEQRIQFVQYIQGINDVHDRRWYASVLLHRLMFIYFLQKKGFIDGRRFSYLNEQLTASEANQPNAFYEHFLRPLFFEGFAKPANQRSTTAYPPLGSIPYLNGGLFLPHQLEKKYPTITIANDAFRQLFALFERYSWNLNDSGSGDDNDINPDVLGYIFEKYINDQKSAGAYYTRAEITDYLCEQTIRPVILAKLHEKYPLSKQYSNLGDLMLKLDAPTCNVLLKDVVPNLTILDPACGSGAFLIAALKTVFDIYTAAIGRIEFLHDADLNDWLAQARHDHPSIEYWIKREIIQNSIFGVDLMEEGMEIARLRLFLALVASARHVDELEPLPNIDFNILAGNSLLGLVDVDPKAIGHTFFQRPYAEIVAEKERLVQEYKRLDRYTPDLEARREAIAAYDQEANYHLNELLQTQFQKQKILLEQPVWDEQQQQVAKKPKTRPITASDLAELNPFHWDYQFHQVRKTGGFDVIIANPPWETWKPQDKEFFAEHSDTPISKNSSIKDFEKHKKRLLKNPEVREAWLDYLEQFPHMSNYFRSEDYFPHQVSYINGKKAASDVNLYKVFTEQCYKLLRTGGMCGIVLPSGIYTDLGTKSLRKLLFEQTKIHGLFGFENRKTIFEGVDSRFKFVVLTFEKGGITTQFPAAFMRLDVQELSMFPQKDSLKIPISLIQQLSPDSLSVMEFKHELDIQIAIKMLDYPLLGEPIANTWNLSLTREFDMTNDSHLFEISAGSGRLPLYEGKMIHQFSHQWGEPRYWVDEKKGRAAILPRGVVDTGQVLDYQFYRLGFRAIARNTDTRTLIVGPIPKNVFCGNSILVLNNVTLYKNIYVLLMQALFNSFVLDFYIRQLVSANINMFYIYQLPVPRLTEKDAAFWPIVERTAQLICTTPEFDALAQAANIGDHRAGVTNEVERQRLRAELDGLIAHLYNLTDEEFSHILKTFPLVPEPTRVAAYNAYRDVKHGLIR